MFVLIVNARQEHLLEVLPIFYFIFEYPDDAILDDVGHNYIFLFDFLPL